MAVQGKSLADRLTAVLAADALAPTVSAATVQQVVECVRHPAPQVVVLGGPRSGTERADDIRLVCDRLADAVVVVVSSTPGGRGVRKALRAGATGFIFESEVEAALAITVRAVAAGQVCIPSELLHHTGQPALSAREKQILGMVVLGFQNQEIAAKLHLAETTVKNHLSSTFKKLDVTSRAEAAALVLDHREGLGPGILSMPGAEAPPAE